MMDYNRLKKCLEKCPNTWLPALFLVLLNRCLHVRVFVDIVKVVSSANEHILKEKLEATKQSGKAPKKQSKPEMIILTCGRCNHRFKLESEHIHRRCGLNNCPGTLHNIE